MGKKNIINFDLLQKLGKVLMVVIAVMPAAGLMISLGKLIQISSEDIFFLLKIGSGELLQIFIYYLLWQLEDHGLKSVLGELLLQ